MPAQYPTCNQPMHFQGATLAISNCIGKGKRLKLLQWGKFSWRLLCNKTADFYDVFPQSTAFALACYKVPESVKYNSMTFGRVGKQRQRAKERLKLQPNCALCLQQMNLTKGSSKKHTTVDRSCCRHVALRVKTTTTTKAFPKAECKILRKGFLILTTCNLNKIDLFSFCLY